ncbi:retrovirus-related pol polyprotein from transposon TNT 1-94 [Tanacetum coccineum]
MEIKDKLGLDQNGSPVDATKFRSMIGAPMYLTSSRPDIVHATYADYAGCKDTFKSNSGGVQFLGEKQVSWSSKKQDSATMMVEVVVSMGVVRRWCRWFGGGVLTEMKMMVTRMMVVGVGYGEGSRGEGGGDDGDSDWEMVGMEVATR